MGNPLPLGVRSAYVSPEDVFRVTKQDVNTENKSLVSVFSKAPAMSVLGLGNGRVFLNQQHQCQCREEMQTLRAGTVAGSLSRHGHYINTFESAGID